MKDSHRKRFWRRQGELFCAFFTFAAVADMGECPAATTVVLFDNFESGDRYNLTAGETLNCDLYQGNWMRSYGAVSFVPDRTAYLDRVDLAVSLVEGYNEVDIVIFAEMAVVCPGGLWRRFISATRCQTMMVTAAPVAATSTVRPELTGGKTYWIGVSPGAAQGKPSGHTVFWHNKGRDNSASAWGLREIGVWGMMGDGWKLRVYDAGGRRLLGVCRPRSDLNGDCKVNLADLAFWRRTGSNADGRIRRS